ncbi:MAG: HD domain-containing protein [Bacteroidales bacterium]|nr:HD domain-containing protein [Bacteroidales bacterium]
MYSEKIAEAANNWIEPVREFIIPLYADQWIPSHDFGHHYRVWKNACRLVDYQPGMGQFFYEELLIACLFHDIGMLYDPTEKHGYRSRILCEQFLKTRRDQLSFNPARLLEAIEYHDDKDYSTRIENNPVYQILCIADDIDAFGALGLYRYLEIYLLRGHTPDNLPALISGNAAGRFKKIMSQSEKLGSDMAGITQRYGRLQKLIMEDGFPESASTLVQWVSDKLVDPRISPWKFFRNYPGTVKNSRINFFLASIREEMEAIEAEGIWIFS